MGELVSHGEARKPAPARVLLQGCQRQQRSLTQFQEPSRGGGCASTMPEVQVEATANQIGCQELAGRCNTQERCEAGKNGAIRCSR